MNSGFHTIVMHFVMLLAFSSLFMEIEEEYHVSGVLISDDQDPVVNHSVKLYDSNNDLLSSVYTDYEGHFVLTYKAISTDSEARQEIPAKYRLGASYPNPFNPRTTIPFEAPESTNATIAVYNLLGQEIMRTQSHISQGSHEIIVNLGSGLSQGHYILLVQGDGYSLTESMMFLSAGISSGSAGISIRSGAPLKTTQSREPSDTGIAARMQSSDQTQPYRLVIEETQAYRMKELNVTAHAHYEFPQPLTISYKGGLVTDIDGNVYRTTQIGNQEWMAENLRVTQYNDGTSIPYEGDNFRWSQLNSPAYSWYEDDESYKTSYGAYYNFYVLEEDKLCPAGWDLPSDEDWKQLEMHLGMSREEADQTGNRGTVEGAMLRATGSRYWRSALGTNETGFSALPAGYRRTTGHFWHAESNAHYWAATPSGGHGYGRFVTHDLDHITRQTYGKTHGITVRCVREAEWHLPSVSTLLITDITANTAVSGGNVTDDGGTTVTERGVVWSISENPTIQQYEGKTSDETGIGEFSSTLSGLTPQTTYYVRAYATNDAGTAYGQQRVFQTLADDHNGDDPDNGEPVDEVTDIDGNTYETVQIGDQEWMAENLRVTRFNDGSAIPTGLSNTDWRNTTSGAYAVYPHGNISGLSSAEEVVQAYGKLYNWFAADDAKGLCPEGWRVPDNEDWNDLLAYLQAEHSIANTNTVDGAANALKSCRQVNSPLGGECSTANHPRWDAHGTHYGTDLFGFSALPGGVRELDGSYYELGKLGYWWTANEENANEGKFIDMNNAFGWVWFDLDDKQMGLSIRCVNEADTGDPVPAPKTEKTYHEDFQTHDQSGWAFLSQDGEISVQNSELRFYSGTLQNVDEGLFAGQMLMYIHRDEEETGPALWSLDEVRVDYTPYLDEASSFQDDFSNIHSPWFRSGDPDIVAESITISNGRLHFNASNAKELSVLSPVGPVQDFSIEVQGGAEGSHNADFSISRMLDYQNYISVFFDEDELFLGYAEGSIEPQILAEASIHPEDVSKLKFSSRQNGTDLELSVRANDQPVLSGTIPNASPRLATGHLAITYMGGTVTNSYLNHALIKLEDQEGE